MTPSHPAGHAGSERTLVRLTEDALVDLRRLSKKDPQAVRWCLKKMLLLERNPEAGKPLLGPLIGYRKLTVGNRDWRLVWRIVHDNVGGVMVDVAEVWAAGARADAEVYHEVQARIDKLGRDPRTEALSSVMQTLQRVDLSGITPTPDPAPEAVPPWLASRLVEQAGMASDDVDALTPEQAMDAWDTWMRSPPD